MQQVHLWDVDLNLLVVLDVLLREQSVTRAARRLGRTQSAVSHALTRLRGLFGDELLVRDGRRMRPTDRGRALAESLPRVLDQVRRTLQPPEPFAAAGSTRVFRLAAPDFAGPLLPLLVQRLAREAPSAGVELVGVGPGALRDLAEGRDDAVLAPAGLEGEGVRSEPLWRLGWAVFGRRGHPAFAAWSAEAWSATPHLLVRTAAGRGEGPVEVAARRAGMGRRVAAVVPTFSLAASVLARTDLLLTVPRLAMAGSAEAFGLDARPTPVPVPPMALALYRSAVSGEEPGVRWFLERVREAAAALGEAA